MVTFEAQCALCVQAFDAAKGAASGLADGLYLSFGLLMTLPVLLVGTVFFAVRRASLRGRSRRGA